MLYSHAGPAAGSSAFSSALSAMREPSDVLRADFFSNFGARVDFALSSVRDVVARGVASYADTLPMHASLEAFRVSSTLLAERVRLFDPINLAGDDRGVASFASSAAMSNAIALAARVDRPLVEAARALSLTAVPDLGSLSIHRAFLDASGLWLARWPQRRLLSAAEKRRRFRELLNRNVESVHVRKAKSLVHRYELVLREIIDAAMALVYGDDWASDRLPLCDCKTLLGKAAARGGDPLDHADYAHYWKIMGDPDHFREVFSVAFCDAETLVTLLKKAGDLRARSHHAREFGPEDLRDLRVTWRTLEIGLVALTADYELDYVSWAS